jgi:hypothetical protein
MDRKFGRFSPDEDAVIIQGRRAGLPWAEIGAALHRSKKQVEQRGVRLLITEDRPRWEPWEQQQIALMLLAGATPAQIRAEFPDRTRHAVKMAIFYVRKKIAAHKC